MDKFETVIKHNGDEKYIVAKIYNTNTKKSKLIVYSSAMKYHQMIANELEEELKSNEEMEVQGGGILR